MTSYPASSAPVLAVPKWLADVLTGDEFTSHGANGSSSNFTAGNGFSPGPIPGGSRDDALYKFACWLRGQGYEEAEAKRRMERRWRDCEPGDHPYTLAEALEEVDRAFRDYPAGNGRGTQTSSGHGKAEAPPAPVDVEALWDARPELGHVRDFALARRAQPWAVLGVALARIVTATPCWLVLPPLVGDVAPLYLFVGVVGKPAAEKGRPPARRPERWTWGH